MTFRKFLISCASLVVGRTVVLDPDVPIGTLVHRMLPIAAGLMRGALFLRRFVVLGRRSHVRASGKLRTNGGLIRIEEHCLIDCLSREGISLGRNFKLGGYSRMIVSGSIADLGKGITIGDNVGIGEFAYIGGAGGVVIGSDCIIGQYLSIHPENHIFSDANRLIRDQGVSRKGIQIGSGCWIGAKVTILDGANIGRDSVIAAGSVVTSSFPERSVIGGVPARLLKSLKDKSTAE